MKIESDDPGITKNPPGKLLLKLLTENWFG